VTAAPDYVDPFVGWRLWRVSDDGGVVRLQSIHFRAEWQPGVPMTATCRRHARSLRHPLVGVPTGHEAPVMTCKCGVHALAHEQQAIVYLDALTMSYGLTSLYAIGQVALWGAVAEHENGWRAASAYPRTIDIRRSGRWATRRLEEIADGLEEYGAPVTIVDSAASAEFHRTHA
jgi:hypothetical protein